MGAQGCVRPHGAPGACEAPETPSGPRAGPLVGLKSLFPEICSSDRLSGLRTLRYADHRYTSLFIRIGRNGVFDQGARDFTRGVRPR
jgi:hypothetical protein